MEAKCVMCKQPTEAGKCVNIDCNMSHEQASQFAGRTTAKATVGAVSGRAPSAFTASGGVD